ncbi:MAG TPA: FAD-dependent monooxygenase, partial [Jatrophihabitantaceae bacterium]|nr:FAD-dependent monooxygenase [Jatrophihabitantaceae bacterium]
RALDTVQALGAPPLPVAYASGGGVEVRADYSPVDGIAHAMCVRRIGLDAALVATARAAGADVREHARVTDLVWRDGRVVGVRYQDQDGSVRQVCASLVVGADGRRSTIADLVGTATPYRARPSGRACYYGYWRDAASSWRDIAAQWRAGGELGTAFPCDDGLVLVLLQPPTRRVDEFRGDVERTYRQTIAAIPGLAARLRDCELMGPVRSATGIESYFRRSSGPGWALVGDAGHFKDPVTAQGIRDALRYGRQLGEAAHERLDDAPALDAAVTRWERDRERDCLEVYQWTNELARGEPMSAIEIELYRAAASAPALAREMTDIFSRVRRPGEVATVRRAAVFAARAVRETRRPGSVARAIARDTFTVVRNRLVRLAAESAQLR